MSAAFAKEAIYIHDHGHLSQADIARATGSTSSTVSSWINETRTPTGQRAERLAELSSIVGRLAQVVSAEYIPVWLHKPIPALDDEKPVDLIARGKYKSVAKLISELESPTFS